jgi:SNF2 family DNA or RNA helicase
MLDRNHLPLLWEMRLGKTLMVIRWAESFRPVTVLVVCPKTVIRVWVEELRKEGIKGVGVTGTQDEKAALLGKNVRWFITNPETLFTRVKAIGAVPNGLSQQPWDVVIIDESTSIKNPKAHITKLCLNRFRTCHRAILTGTISPENDLDMFCQMQFLYGSFMGCRSYWQFRSRYFEPADWRGWSWEYKPGARQEVRHALKQKAFILSASQAGLNMKIIRQTRYITLPPRIVRAYKKAEKMYVLGTEETIYDVVKLHWLSRLTGGALVIESDGKKQSYEHNAKLNELLLLLEGELARKPVVVWFRYNTELIKVKRALRLKRIPVMSILGATPSNDRGRILAELGHTYRVLLMQAKVGQFGIDCSAASAAIHYSRYYDGIVNMQADRRLSHPSRADPPLIIDLVAEDTVDEDVIEQVRKKKQNMRSIMYVHRGVRQRWAKRAGAAK